MNSNNQWVMIDKQQARASFSRAAERYDEVAVLQRETGQRLIDRMDMIKFQPTVILDLGAGTGVATAALAKKFKKAQIYALDFALPMLKQTRKRGSWLRRPRCICGDMEQLPLADQSVDFIYSNAALQWSNDLGKTFSEFKRVLKPGGLLLFTTFGPDTLYELRDSWAAVDGTTHVTPFPDMHDVGDAMMRAGLATPVMDVDRMVLTYESVSALMKDLKQLGANNAAQARHRGLTGKQRMQGMINAYETFRQDDRIPATYEVVYGHAWAPTEEQTMQRRTVSVDQLRQSLK
jgi:malonyl-CoA O-methyltransferase